MFIDYRQSLQPYLRIKKPLSNDFGGNVKFRNAGSDEVKGNTDYP
jgi:hypothetical protein